MNDLEEIKSEIISMINDRQQVTLAELRDFAAARKIEHADLERGLHELEASSAIASRNSGGIPTYYLLQSDSLLRRIMIVEDDKNISRLMAITIGKEFDISQIYDGKEALQRIRSEKPDLVVLDLMLPGADGLEICNSIKTNPNLKDITVIIVSAMDATSNRFKGIKNGADYYIKKPFEPAELRSLVRIFLKKKGKKFDPLIDLPNEDKISDAIEKVLEQKSDYEIGRLRVDGLAAFASRFGNESGITILRLVSQLLQDKVTAEKGSKVFVGFLNADDFVIAGTGSAPSNIAKEVSAEFDAVEPFIYQSEGYKPIELGIEDIYGAEKPTLRLKYSEIKRTSLIERRAEVLKNKIDIGSYTYEELRHILGGDNLDITITRNQNGVRLSIGKGGA